MVIYDYVDADERENCDRFCHSERRKFCSNMSIKEIGGGSTDGRRRAPQAAPSVNAGRFSFPAKAQETLRRSCATMALIESMPPPKEEQKRRLSELHANQRRAEAERQAQLASEAITAGGPDDGAEIFPPLPWRPKIVLRLSGLHWKANIELCKRIHFMMRQFRHLSQWLSKNAPLGTGLSREQLEPMRNMTNAINSHVSVVRLTKRVSGLGCISPAKLLDFEDDLAKLHKIHRAQWSPQYRAELKAARAAQEIEMAPMTATIKEMLKDTSSDQDGKS